MSSILVPAPHTPRLLVAVRRCLPVILLLGHCLAIPMAQAAIEVKIEEPQWKFLLANQPLGQTQAELTPDESSFARTIQPLLASGDHQAVMNAFAERDITKDSAALRLLRGQVLLELRRMEAAEAALQAALELMPNLALAHRGLSMAYLIEEKYDQARTHLTRSIELGVADAQLYGQLAYVNLQSGNAASALSGYQMALFLDSGNEQWKKGLLYALINSHAYEQAQALIEELLLLHPDDASLWLQRSQVALAQERELDALASMEQAITLGEDNPANLLIAAQLHLNAGSHDRAVQLMVDNMTTFMQNDPAAGATTVDQMAGWLAHQQNWAGLAALMESVGRSTTKPAAIFASRFDAYRAQVAISKGDIQQANQVLERSLQADPANGEALLALAGLLQGQSRPEAALPYYVRAEALPSFKERAQLGRAQLEIDRQNYDEALRVLRQFARANPSRDDVMSNIRSLENLVRNRR